MKKRIQSALLMVKRMHNVPSFKARGEIHIARKLFHVIGVMIILIGYLYLPRQIALLALIGVMLIIIPVDVLRQKFPFLQKNSVLYFWAIDAKGRNP